MTNKLTRGIEISANVAIIIVAVLLGVVLVRSQLLPGAHTQATAPQPHMMAAAGSKLPLSGVNWAENRRTLLLALSAKCHFCTESAEFYKRLVEARAEHSDIRMVAVLPQDIGEGRAYMDKLGIKVDEVRQSSLDSVGATGTPTLIMVDGDGAATELWVGKLPPDKESEVLDRIRGERASR
jgi:hypothetical protein